MKFGAIVEVEGHGRATVVYNFLDGVGVVWGEQDFSEIWEEMKEGAGFSENAPIPEVLLRDHPDGEVKDFFKDGSAIECLSAQYSIVKKGLS